MTQADLFAFRSALKDLHEGFGKPLSDGRLQFYWTPLQDLDIGAVRHGIEQAVKHERYCPSPAVIRAYAVRRQTEQQRQAVQSVNLDAGETWCRDCEDTGWIEATRYSMLYQRDIPCVRRCPCRASNPVYRAKNPMGGRSSLRQDDGGAA